MGIPTLARVLGEGETHDVDVQAHINAPQGINTWAGTARDGTPVWVDSEGKGEPMWVKGQEARKCAQQPSTRDEVIKQR